MERIVYRQSTVCLIILLITFALSGCEEVKKTGGKKLFIRGRDLVRAGRYEEAIGPLTQFQREHPRAELASNAGLYLGKAYLALGRFDEARIAWGNTMKDYPGSLEEHKCRYKLALLKYLEGDTEEALKLFKAMAEDPDGPLAAEALAFASYIERRSDAKKAADPYR
ncbi:tol-pal system YbgF family protein [Candidatus Hydrogenedentota bacterium]